MTITVEVRPAVENLNYEGITVKEVPVEINEEEIEAVLRNLADEKATYESSEESISSGDLVTIDYTVKDDGSSAKDIVLKIGSGPYPKEFYDGLIGRKKDEELEIDAVFPDDFQSPFAGKRINFEIKVKDVKRRNALAIDDEFAKDLGFENLGLLKDKIRENVLASKNREAERVKQKEILDRLIESHNFELPESLVNAEVSGIISEIRASGKDTKTDDELKGEIMPHAEKSVKASILLELIGEKEGINVSDEEIKEEILNIAQRYYISPENVMKYYMARDGSLERLKRSVFEKKVLNFLLNKAKIINE
jgi:trigger factor